MDFSDYLRRKNGQGVYSGYKVLENQALSNCPSAVAPCTDVKALTFADIYNINIGARECTSSNGYINNIVCGVSLYSNTTR